MSALAAVEGYRGLDLRVHRGDVVLLRGSNGSGKTSLLRALAGLDAPVRPRTTTRADGLRVAYAPQDSRDALIGLTVGGEFRLRRRAPPPRLAPFASRASVELSSGETRRVCLGIADEADLVLLDEPAEGLDAEGARDLADLVARAATRGAVVAADHGRALEPLATRIVDLGSAPRVALAPVPRAEGAPVLDADAATLRGVQLPALTLGPGLHALRAANGRGKSTLLARLAGLLDARGVRILGEPPRPGENVRLLLPHAGDLLARERVADECPPSPLVPDALRARHPLALSGGEAQRVALAKTLARPAPLLLLDEPEAHLDAEGRALLARLLAQRVREGACVLAATHDEEIAALGQGEVRL